MGSHNVTCHPTQVNAPQPIGGYQFTYPRALEGSVDLGGYLAGLPVGRQSPIQVLTGPNVDKLHPHIYKNLYRAT